MNQNGYKENTAWVGKADAMLVYDYDQDGVISQTKEVVLSLWDRTRVKLAALSRHLPLNW